MTRTERKLLRINGLLGTGLTLLVLVLDWGGQLQALERWFYDRRALYCQFFAKPPTDRLVFLDIDDNALDTIGRWPWPRNKWARIIDEVSAAGPQLIFLDVLFSEPQNAYGDPQPDGSYVRIDHDPPLAAALHRAANVFVPLSLDFSELNFRASPVNQAMYELFLKDLELTPAEMAARIEQVKLPHLRTREEFNDHFLVARRAALAERIRRELANGPAAPAELRARLLPKTDPRQVSSPMIRLFEEEFDKVERLAPLDRFMLPERPGFPPLMAADDEIAPLAIFGREAGGSGFVNNLDDPDGVVRRIPLMIRQRGRVVPQVGFAIACRLLGADPKDAKVFADRITIPCSNGRAVNIPVITREQTTTGERIGTLMNISFFGGRDWQTMFDPAHKDRRYHLPMNLVWQVFQTRDAIITNNNTADRAINDLEELFPDDVAAYAAKKPDPADPEARLPILAKFLESIDSFLKAFQDVQNPTETERKQIEGLKYTQSGIRAASEEIRRLAGQLKDQRAELRRAFSGKAIFVGSIAGSSAYDLKPTPLHEKCPGVVVHGVVANAILTGELWSTAPVWVTRLLTILTGLATTAFVLRLRTTRAAMAGMSLAALYLLVNGIVVFDYFNVIVGVAGPIVAVLVTWVSCQLVEILVEKAERRRITRRFSSYADPALVKYVIDHPEQNVMSGHEREMTVVFTDLAGFTTISETLREKVVPLLNEYLGMMAKIVARHNGYVNKFLGDGIMFFYNAPRDNPDHAGDAIVTVLEMQEAVAGFNRSLKERGLPEISMRAGITTGPMVVGDAGSTDRADYTVIGDNVNLAARLESANKATDTKVLMTVRTAQMLGDRYLVRPAARLQVKGKSEGVDTCVLVARASEATEQQRRLASLWKQIFDAYVRADFAGCKRALDELESTAGPDKLTQAYRELCEQYLKEPPMNGFDGHIVLHEK
jgi:class 3 adenylate cyclase/CHASE2 domain-containing sensor protein